MRILLEVIKILLDVLPFNSKIIVFLENEIIGIIKSKDNED